MLAIHGARYEQSESVSQGYYHSVNEADAGKQGPKLVGHASRACGKVVGFAAV